jgi:hypothetical protein
MLIIIFWGMSDIPARLVAMRGPGRTFAVEVHIADHPYSSPSSRWVSQFTLSGWRYAATQAIVLSRVA